MRETPEDLFARHFHGKPGSVPVFQKNGRHVCVSPFGSMDLENSHGLRDFLVDLIEHCNSSIDLEVDLSNVQYISSTGVGALVDALVTAKRNTMQLKVHGFQPKVRDVFKLLGLISFFEEQG